MECTQTYGRGLSQLHAESVVDSISQPIRVLVEGKGQPGQGAGVDHRHGICEQWTMESERSFHLRYYRELDLECFCCYIGLRSPDPVLRSSLLSATAIILSTALSPLAFLAMESVA